MSFPFLKKKNQWNIYLANKKKMADQADPEQTPKKTPHAASFVAFAYSLLYGKIKGNALDPKNKEHLQMLDPFVAILNEGLGAKENKVVSYSLKILCALI